MIKSLPMNERQQAHTLRNEEEGSEVFDYLRRLRREQAVFEGEG